MKRRENVRAKKKTPLQRLAKEYLLELDSHHLEVVLVPSRDHDCALRGGMIRAVQEQNAEWYRKFCSEHESNRKDRLRWSKFKTKIKREQTRNALLELIAGKCETHYARDLRDFIERDRAEKRKRDRRVA